MSNRIAPKLLAEFAASGFDCGAAVRARSKYQEIFQ
jgi:hypothetical protein